MPLMTDVIAARHRAIQADRDARIHRLRSAAKAKAKSEQALRAAVTEYFAMPSATVSEAARCAEISRMTARKWRDADVDEQSTPTRLRPPQPEPQPEPYEEPVAMAQAEITQYLRDLGRDELERLDRFFSAIPSTHALRTDDFERLARYAVQLHMLHHYEP